MSKCSECTYLNPNSCYSDGTFWCEKKLECVYANQEECYRFCRAYSRPSSVAKSYEEFSISKTSSSGCYLTTMLCKILELPDDNQYLNSFRNFRNNVLQKDIKYKKILAEYDIIGPIIAEALNNDPLNHQISISIFYNYIRPINKLIIKKENDEAVYLYKEMTTSLKNLYSINRNLTVDEINNISIEKSGHGICKLKKITN